MAGNTRTTSKHLHLGSALRALREAADFTVRELGSRLDTSYATVSRWETGQRSPKLEDVAAYLQAVQAPSGERERLLELAREPDGPRWLSVGMPEQRHQLAALLEIEREATRITSVSPLLVPGLLQTADYARAIMTAAAVPTDEIDTRVAVRLGRRDTIARRNPAHLRAYVGESALRQVMGDQDVMLDQLRELKKLGSQPNVEVRVLPIRTDWHAGLEGPFTVVEFNRRDTIVSVENRVSALYLHDPADVAAYRDALPRVEQLALSVENSMALIAELTTELEG